MLIVLFHLCEHGACHDGGCAIGAGAVRSGGVALHDYESKASYKLFCDIRSVFDAASFALTILIFALGTTSSQAFPEQALRNGIFLIQ
jgi:hypothetical protein